MLQQPRRELRLGGPATHEHARALAVPRQQLLVEGAGMAPHARGAHDEEGADVRLVALGQRTEPEACAGRLQLRVERVALVDGARRVQPLPTVHHLEHPAGAAGRLQHGGHLRADGGALLAWHMHVRVVLEHQRIVGQRVVILD